MQSQELTANQEFIGAVFVGLALGGVIRIVWAYLKDGSLLDAVA